MGMRNVVTAVADSYDIKDWELKGRIWKKLNCPECKTETSHNAWGLNVDWSGDGADPYVRLLQHKCNECNYAQPVINLTDEAQLEWEENAEYCSQNFTNYIVMKDQERADMNLKNKR